MAKPFSIQSPEDIATQYGGNKQKIAQAMQMGIVDPTAGVLAGMFIDRMRSPAGQEAPPATVAQQVFAPQGGAPAPGGAPQQGLGAIPPQGAGAPPPDMGQEAQQMGAPQEAPPQQMAEGGIAGLDVPDTMFDEPSNGGFNDGFAGGGLVAFARGGTSYDDYANATIAQESGGNYRARNAESGALGRYQMMPATAKALASRLGKAYRPDLLTSDSAEAQAYQDALGHAAMREAYDYGHGDMGLAASYYHAGPNKKGWGDKTARYAEQIKGRMGQRMGDDAPLQERDMKAPEGRRKSLLDWIGTAQDMDASMPQADDTKLREMYTKDASPEEGERRRKEDMWAALANIGANMAATDSPYFLQSVGKALAEAMPGALSDKKSRRADSKAAIEGMAGLDDKRRKEAWEVAKFGAGLGAADADAEQTEAKMSQSAEEAAKDRAFRASEGDKDRKAQERIARARQPVGGSQRYQQYQSIFTAKLAELREMQNQGKTILMPDGRTRAVAHGRNGQETRISEAGLQSLAHQYAMQMMKTSYKGGEQGDPLQAQIANANSQLYGGAPAGTQQPAAPQYQDGSDEY